MELPSTHSAESFLLQATPMTALSIPRGELRDVVVAAGEGKAIVWQFLVLSLDVSFRVFVDGFEVPTFTKRVDTMDSIVDGTLELSGRTSSICLQWDNSYSMLRGKEIQYRVMAVPTSTLHAAREAANEYHIKFNHPVHSAIRSHNYPSPLSRSPSMPPIPELHDASSAATHDALTHRLESAVVDTVAVFMTQPDTPLHAGSARPLVLALEAILRHGAKPATSSHPPEELYFRFLVETRNVLREDMSVVSDAELFTPPPFMRYLGWGRARAFLFFALNRRVLHRALENLIKRRSLVDRFYDSSTALLADYPKAKRAISCLSALYGVSFCLTPLKDDFDTTAATFPPTLYQAHAWEPFVAHHVALADGAGDVAFFQGTSNVDDFTAIQDCTPAKYLCLSTPTTDVTVPRGGRVCIPLNMHDEAALVAAIQFRVTGHSVHVGFGLKSSSTAVLAPLRLVQGSPTWVEVILRLEYPIPDLHLVLDNSQSLIRAKTVAYRFVVASKDRYTSAWAACSEVAHVICWKHVIQRSLDWSAKRMEAMHDEEQRWLAPAHPPPKPSTTTLTESVTSWLGSVLLPNDVACAQCAEPFTLFRRRQECSLCRKGFCLACTRHMWAASPVCDRCYLRELDKRIAQSRADQGNARSDNPALDALRQNTTYDKYFKMLSFGVPPSAIGQKMQQDYIPQDIVDIFVSGLDGSSTQSRHPPTPSSGGSSRPQLLRKKSTLRKLHWTALDAAKGKATIWNRVTDKRRHAPVALSGSDMDRVVACFGEASVAEKRAMPAAKSGGKVQSALDGRRANNIHIGLSRFKAIGPAGLVAALRECRLDLLTPEVLQTLAEIGPTPVELKRYSNFRGSVQKLDEAERFLVDMAKVSRVQEKIHVMLFVQQYATLIDDLTDRLRVLSVACHQILSSERLPRYFEVILALGNVLNEGTDQANATGVTLASLLKLSETRSIDQSMTLLQFLMQLIHERGEMDLFHVMDELDMLDAAKRFSNVQCVSQLAHLQKQLSHLVHEVKEEDTTDRMLFEKNRVEERRKRHVPHIPSAKQVRPAAAGGGHHALMAALRKRTSAVSEENPADDAVSEGPRVTSSSEQQRGDGLSGRGALFASIRKQRGSLEDPESASPSTNAAKMPSIPPISQSPSTTNDPEPPRPNNAGLLAAIRSRQQDGPPPDQPPHVAPSSKESTREKAAPMAKSALMAAIRNRPSAEVKTESSAVSGRQALMAAIAFKNPSASDDGQSSDTPSAALLAAIRSRPQPDKAAFTPEEEAPVEYAPNAFLRAMEPHVSRIKHELSLVQDKLESMTDHWHDVAVYLGESPATPSDYALGLLHRFMLDVKVAFRVLVSKGLIPPTSIGSATNVGDRVATVLGAATVLAQRQRNLEVSFPWAKAAYLQPTAVLRPGDRVVCRQFGRGILTATRYAVGCVEVRLAFGHAVLSVDHVVAMDRVFEPVVPPLRTHDPVTTPLGSGRLLRVHSMGSVVVVSLPALGPSSPPGVQAYIQASQVHFAYNERRPVY